MTVSVGRVRECPVLTHKFVALGHNTIRGAAGASILNAELMKAEGLLERSSRSDRYGRSHDELPLVIFSVPENMAGVSSFLGPATCRPTRDRSFSSDNVLPSARALFR